MSLKLDQFFDHAAGRTKYRIGCSVCDRWYHICQSPTAAKRAAVKKGWDEETGLCKTCRVITKMDSLKRRPPRERVLR